MRFFFLFSCEIVSKSSDKDLEGCTLMRKHLMVEVMFVFPSAIPITSLNIDWNNFKGFEASDASIFAISHGLPGQIS